MLTKLKLVVEPEELDAVSQSQHLHALQHVIALTNPCVCLMYIRIHTRHIFYTAPIHIRIHIHIHIHMGEWMLTDADGC
jgi:hypothetical protein